MTDGGGAHGYTSTARLQLLLLLYSFTATYDPPLLLLLLLLCYREVRAANQVLPAATHSGSVHGYPSAVGLQLLLFDFETPSPIVFLAVPAQEHALLLSSPSGIADDSGTVSPYCIMSAVTV